MVATLAPMPKPKKEKSDTIRVRESLIPRIRKAVANHELMHGQRLTPPDWVSMKLEAIVAEAEAEFAEFQAKSKTKGKKGE